MYELMRLSGYSTLSDLFKMVRLYVGLFPTLLAMSTSVFVGASSREKLTAMLLELDSKASVDSLQKLISADEVGSFLERSHHVHASSNRRRGGHTPCECPEGTSDYWTNDCIRRRFSIVGDMLNIAQTSDITYGFGTDTGRLSLRAQFLTFQEEARQRHSDVAAATDNLTNPSTGYVIAADKLSQRIMNEEMLMAQSVNNAWMSLVNISVQTTVGANDVIARMSNATSGMYTWFTNLQSTEESTTWNNMLRAVSIAQGSLNYYVTQINGAEMTVYNMLVGLESSMGGSEAKTDSLADALSSAADNLQDSLESFQASIAYLAQPTVDQIESNLDGLVRQYETYTQGQLSGLSSTASGKLNSARTESTNSINAQRTQATVLINSATNATTVALAATTANQQTFTDNARVAFQDVASHVEAVVQNYTNVVNAATSADRTNLTAISDMVDRVNAIVTTYSGDEKRLSSNAAADSSAGASAANQALNDGLTAVNGKQGTILQSANTVGEGAVEAVGTNFESNLDQMGVTTNGLLGSLSTEASSAAKNANDVAAGLAIVAERGGSSVSSAAASVVGQLQGAFQDILGSVGGIPGGIGAGASAQSMLAIVSASRTNRSQASGLIKQMLFGSQAGTMQNQTATESAIDGFLDTLAAAGPQADSIVNALGASVGNTSITAQGVVASVTDTDAKNTAATSAAANSVAQAETNFASALASILNSATSGATPGVGGLQGGVSGTLLNTNELVTSAQTKLDGWLADQEKQGLNNVQAVTDAQSATAGAGSDIEHSMAAMRDQLSQGLDGAVGDVDAFLSDSTNSAAVAVGEQLRAIDALKTDAALKMGTISAGQMEQIRGLAASIDSLMQQVNGFLGSNAQPLYNQIQQLAGKAQKLYMYMAALGRQADNIKTDAEDEGQYSWDEVLRVMLAALRTDNSSAHGDLAKIGADFNASAGLVSQQTVDSINDLIAKYSAEANSLQSNLDGVRATAQAAADNGDIDQDVMTQIQGVYANASALAATAATMMQSTTAGLAGSRPAEMGTLYSAVDSQVLAASTDAKYASYILGKLQTSASGAVANATAAAQANQVPASEVERQASLARLNANVANTQLMQRKAEIDALSSDAGSVADDYQREVQIQTLAHTEKANTVYDSVVAAKGDVTQMLGRITSKIVAIQAGKESDASLSDAEKQIKIGLLRRAVVALLDIFDKFMDTVRANFDAGEEDRDGFATTLLTHMRQRLVNLDNELYKNNQDLVQMVTEVETSAETLTQADIDNQVKSFEDRFAAWEKTQEDAVAADAADLPTIVNDASLAIPTSVDESVSVAVKRVAETARSVLESNKRTVPDEILSIINTP